MVVKTKRVNKPYTTKQKKKAERLKTATGYVGFNANQGIYYPDGQALWKVAENNEFGAITKEGLYSPPRPFMRTTIDENRDEYAQNLKEVAKQYLEGGKGARLTMVSALKIMKMDIQESILSWDTPPNAPMTIERKGFNDPLIDTKVMLKNVTYWVKK